MSKHRRTTGAIDGPTRRKQRQPKGQQPARSSQAPSVPGMNRYLGILKRVRSR